MTAPKKDHGQKADVVVLGDRYRLEAQVAAGGMGEVWRATDTLLERTVAVKLLRESLAEDPVLSERFRREALMAARLSHPNMADVFDYVQEDARPGIVMEYVEGETLAERIAREGQLSVGDAVRITSALLAVLQVAHDQGIVHRDVKPGNIMLPPADGVKVTDFGIARATGHETLTETGMVVGTAHYLSPEQVSGKPATPLSDIYSAGAILYETLTGKKPFEAETPLAVAMRRLNEDPAAPRTYRPDLPEAIEHVVMRGLARDPQKRFSSAAAMRSALEGAYAAAQSPTMPGIDATQVMPVAELPAPVSGEAPTTVIHPEAVTPPHPTLAPEPEPVTGDAPAAVVARRRLREYRRGAVWLVIVAAIVGIGAWALMASGGRGPVAVPDFTGMQIGPARAAAEDLGLRVATTQVDSDRPAGEVIAQDIPANRRIAQGELVTLTISTGTPPAPPCCEVPDLVGLSEEDAKDAITDAGLEVGKITHFKTEQFDAGTVIGQTPNSGETKPEGTEVDMLVAEGRGKGKGNGD